MRGKITIRSVEALAADDGKEVTLRDSGLAGFEVRARAGGAKVYGLRYRVGAGRDAPMKRARSAGTARRGRPEPRAPRRSGCWAWFARQGPGGREGGS